MMAKGMIHAEGTRLVDASGAPFQVRGVNLGNWFVPEMYMSAADVGSFDTGVYTLARAERAMRANPNLTEAQIDELYHIYMQSYITEADFQEIVALGLNTVRLPFVWQNLTTDGETIRPDGFRYVDWTVEMCEKYGLYVVLDLHGAVGSQNQDFHCGDDEHFDLYGNPENRRKTIHLWEQIAARYRGKEIVLGYDLLNECRKAPGKFGGKVCTDFYDELYKAVRKVDPDHLIFIEYFTFPIHGTGVRNYNWENVAAEYHIYNLTPLSQINCLRLIRLMHLFTGNTKVPVYVGEFNAWNKVKDWEATVDYFERHGWAWSSWCWKANEYPYKHEYAQEHAGRDWGPYVLDQKPVDLSTATFEEIAAAYRATETSHAKKTYIYDFYRGRFGK